MFKTAFAASVIAFAAQATEGHKKHYKYGGYGHHQPLVIVQNDQPAPYYHHAPAPHVVHHTVDHPAPHYGHGYGYGHGHGYGGYGGTGPMFTGFEFRMYIDPVTGREIQIIFFNGRPLSPIPEGYVRKGQEVVEAIEEVGQSDDGGTSIEPPKINTWDNTNID